MILIVYNCLHFLKMPFLFKQKTTHSFHMFIRLGNKKTYSKEKGK